MENNSESCANCEKYSNVQDCSKYNNFISKFFTVVFRSDRPACISMIKEKGYENFAEFMAENKWQTIKK